MEKSVPHKVTEVISEEKIHHDLKHYQEAALDLKGITGAAIIGRSDIFVDPRASLKCYIPKCWAYGRCASCPPHTLKPEETQKLVDLYHHAIFIKSDLPSDAVAGPAIAKALVTHGTEEDALDEKCAVAARSTINIIKAVSKIESMAFYDGYYFAMGFSAGTCRVTLCWKYPNCAVLSGEKCRHVYLSRPSMEAVGFNVYKMATRVGWDIYTIGATCFPADVPHALLMGIVLVT